MTTNHPSFSPFPKPKKRTAMTNQRSMTLEKGSSQNNQMIVIASGDPAGIGVEITLKALASSKLPSDIHPLVVGCKKNLEATHKSLKEKGIAPLVNLKDIEIEDIPYEEPIKPGFSSAKTGEASFQYLTRATEFVINGEARALVTGPIAKYTWHAAGHIYPGQTERLAEISKVKEASMMFSAISPHNNWRFNTLLATTHIPLSKVSNALTHEVVSSKLQILLEFCKKYTNNPHITVAGLNPHAGEQGELGQEEKKWLAPLLEQWKASHPEVELSGPIPPDTCWLSAAKAWMKGPTTKTPNGYLALYHDQGLIPMKILAFEEAVNITLGLPFIRTSPDHGTGFDIAGQGIAQEKSMLAALITAWELSKKL